MNGILLRIEKIKSSWIFSHFNNIDLEKKGK